MFWKAHIVLLAPAKKHKYGPRNPVLSEKDCEIEIRDGNITQLVIKRTIMIDDILCIVDQHATDTQKKPVLKGCLEKGDLEEIQKLKSRGWKFDQEALDFYNLPDDIHKPF
ncbi:MAG: hypothetical protein WCO30_01175 [bacterium]